MRIIYRGKLQSANLGPNRQVLPEGIWAAPERSLPIDEQYADRTAARNRNREWNWNGRRRRVQEPELQVPEPRGTARQDADPDGATRRRAAAHHYRFQSADAGRFGARGQQEQTDDSVQEDRQVAQIAIISPRLRGDPRSDPILQRLQGSPRVEMRKSIMCTIIISYVKELPSVSILNNIGSYEYRRVDVPLHRFALLLATEIENVSKTRETRRMLSSIQLLLSVFVIEKLSLILHYRLILYLII